MTDFLKYILQQEPSSFLDFPEYIGQTFDRIIRKHPYYNQLPYFNEKEKLLIEIRLDDATLSCVIKNNICIEAYKFTDFQNN
ncbi:MAG: hypothetical protein LBR52_03505 [Prevotellaceae bacterium]|jgi:hypothetical protein|nr:hypothetical protein [Prevotellaceae bacterium]